MITEKPDRSNTIPSLVLVIFRNNLHGSSGATVFDQTDNLPLVQDPPTAFACVVLGKVYIVLPRNTNHPHHAL
jgi:hypothetical protein